MIEHESTKAGERRGYAKGERTEKREEG